jgi:hypothetical protein
MIILVKKKEVVLKVVYPLKILYWSLTFIETDKTVVEVITNQSTKRFLYFYGKVLIFLWTQHNQDLPLLYIHPLKPPISEFLIVEDNCYCPKFSLYITFCVLRIFIFQNDMCRSLSKSSFLILLYFCYVLPIHHNRICRQNYLEMGSKKGPEGAPTKRRKLKEHTQLYT